MSSGSLEERYRAGETVAVWQELIELDRAVRDPAHLEGARAVAAEAMRRLRHNLELLVGRLGALGYRFERASTAAVLAPPAPDTAERVARFEAELGPLPLALVSFYEQIGEIDLRGRLDAWEPPGALAPTSRLCALIDEQRCYADPLVVPPLAALQNEVEQRTDELAELEGEEALLVGFSGDAMAKTDGSGGLYGIVLPDPAFDTDIEVHHATCFGDFLRDALRWAGFPGWAQYARPPVSTIEALRGDFLAF